jgi:hypothetical protein
VDIVRVARGIADDVLFPAALATEASDVVPRQLRDTLAAAVPADRVTSQHPPGDRASPEVLRTHAALALGVASRCCAMLRSGSAWEYSPTPLDGELTALRAELDRLGPGTAAARAAAGELALRAASALMTTVGSRSLLVTEHGQRLAKEAMFTLVYALRPGSRSALLARLGAPEGQ